MEAPSPPPFATTTTTTAVLALTEAARSSCLGSIHSPSPSRKTASPDNHPLPSSAAAAPLSAEFSKLRLMCSYGGRIVPRTGHKSLFYIGGETRLVVVDRASISLSSLATHLSHKLLNGRPFSLKYQLPDEDLETLLSIITDEDLKNMIEEYDRIMSSSSSMSSNNKPTRRLRLFLFFTKPELTLSVGQILQSTIQSEDWLVNALNDSGLLNRAFPDSASVNSTENGDRREDQKVGIEGQFALINVNGCSQKQHEQDKGFAAIASPPQQVPATAAHSGVISSMPKSQPRNPRNQPQTEKNVARDLLSPDAVSSVMTSITEQEPSLPNPSVSVRVSDHPVDSIPNAKVKIPNSYNSQHEYELQQRQAQPQQEHWFSESASHYVYYVIRAYSNPRLDQRFYPVYYMPMPVYTQLRNDPMAEPEMVNDGVYRVSPSSESPQLVHGSKCKHMQNEFVGYSSYGYQFADSVHSQLYDAQQLTPPPRSQH